MLKTINLIRNIYFQRSHPVSLVHFVTNRCNARCSFCFIDFDDPETFRHELNLEEIEKLTKSVGPYLQNVNITGGEPFSRRDILDVVRLWFANTPIKSVFITSNGSLPHRIIPFAKTISEEFPDRLLIFSLSIDGLPDLHNKIRKIPELFDNVMKTYHGLRELGGNVQVNIGITVSHENCDTAEELYQMLKVDYGVKAITATLVRDEGVFKVPKPLKEKILNTYGKIIESIREDLSSGALSGYDKSTLQGRLMNKKNILMNNIIKNMYLKPSYISPCHAGSLFGIIEANGDVKPCEILSDSMGNLRDWDMNFAALWSGHESQKLKKWIIESKCHCTYECAWSFNILGNWRYQGSLIAAALKIND